MNSLRKFSLMFTENLKRYKLIVEDYFYPDEINKYEPISDPTSGVIDDKNIIEEYQKSLNHKRLERLKIYTIMMIGIGFIINYSTKIYKTTKN